MHKFDGIEVELISWDGVEDKEIVKKFRDIKLTNAPKNNFFTVGSLSSLDSVMRLAYECYMFGSEFNWIMITDQTGPVKCLNCVHSRFFHVQPIESRLYEYTAPIDPPANQTTVSDGGDALSKYFYYDLASYYARTVDR